MLLNLNWFKLQINKRMTRIKEKNMNLKTTGLKGFKAVIAKTFVVKRTAMIMRELENTMRNKTFIR